MVPEMFPRDVYTYERFVWMTELWFSYPFEIRLSNGTTRTCLLPLADLLNHSPYPHVARYGHVDPSSKTLDLPVMRGCPEGQQVFLSYGYRPNAKLLLFYGFCIPNNPHDVFNIGFDLEGDALAGVKRRCLKNLGLDTDHQLRAGMSGRLPPRLLAAFRVFVADKDEVGKVLRGHNPLAEPVSSDNERRAVSLLRESLSSSLDTYSRPLRAATECGRHVMPHLRTFLDGQAVIIREAIRICDAMGKKG
jgi:hypothetical protein